MHKRYFLLNDTPSAFELQQHAFTIINGQPRIVDIICCLLQICMILFIPESRSVKLYGQVCVVQPCFENSRNEVEAGAPDLFKRTAWPPGSARQHGKCDRLVKKIGSQLTTACGYCFIKSGSFPSNRRDLFK